MFLQDRVNIENRQTGYAGYWQSNQGFGMPKLSHSQRTRQSTTMRQVFILDRHKHTQKFGSRETDGYRSFSSCSKFPQKAEKAIELGSLALITCSHRDEYSFFVHALSPSSVFLHLCRRSWHWLNCWRHLFHARTTDDYLGEIPYSGLTLIDIRAPTVLSWRASPVERIGTRDVFSQLRCQCIS